MNRTLSIVATVVIGVPALLHAAEDHPTDWFQRAGYGVFVHYLDDLQNDSESIHSLGRRTSWDVCVREFDAERFADAMRDAGAGYVIFTMHQRTRFLIAPNATFDRISGYKPGEACATRDLVEDLYQALHRRGIPLMLYTTGNGPSQDPKAGPAFGCSAPVTTEYVTKWASVIEEYSKRYGEKVSGWWVDGCYHVHGNLGYDDETLGILARALKAGNPRSIIALNNGVDDRVRPYSIHEDFTCGEQNQFSDKPASRWLDGQQWHILSFLGFSSSDNILSAGWGQPGVHYPRQVLAEYIADVNRAGGVVSIDVLLYRDGSLDRSQLETLKGLRQRVTAALGATAVPPGNLAWHKPARLLNLDGAGELPVNGSGGRGHDPRCGVDGRLDTDALASNQWPWTYEVNLIEVRSVRRMKVHFAPSGFATKLRIQVSDDARNWHTVATADNLDGAAYTAEFAPTKAQWIRLSAIEPNGPNQKGGQMAVAELEVYE